jgi:glycosyltransferase involved in cell wall biosynthesis
MRIACVVHRYGPDIAGGSETHCRQVAEHLAASHDVTVLTTCAADHVTWKNVYPAGESQAGGVRVRRFPTVRQRSLSRFTEASEIAFSKSASEADQLHWFRENGPDAPALLSHLAAHGREFDRILFWAFRYAETYFGLPLVHERAVLVPTVEDDPVIAFSVLQRFFSLPAAFVFLTPEEQTLVTKRMSGCLASSVVIGAGLDPVAAAPSTASSLDALGVRRPFLLYLGRVDPNKGCEALLRHFVRFQDAHPQAVQLVLAGPANMPIPDHPQVRPLGFVDHATREALLAQAACLVVPSRYESLSMVLLEGWNHGLAALVNGRCDVLKGQALRANGALYYRDYDEFAHSASRLLGDGEMARQLGRQGLDYVNREYRWPHVLAKLDHLLARVGQGGLEKGTGVISSPSFQGQSPASR